MLADASNNSTSSHQQILSNPVFSFQQLEILEQYFWKFAANGELLTWKSGFIKRCQERKLNCNEKIENFCNIALYLEQRKSNCGLLDVTEDVRAYIEGNQLDQLFYVDQYKRMEFGRGKLAEMTFYAKDLQDKKLIQQSLNLVRHQLESLIATQQIDAIAFAPHSKKRQIQLLKELEKMIDLQWKPTIKLIKYAPYGTIIAQKSLKTREQRIQNARETILIDGMRLEKAYHKVLLIDDFVWSGATLNETAKKLKSAGAKQVIWFAFVGNMNLSYEVINEI